MEQFGGATGGLQCRLDQFLSKFSIAERGIPSYGIAAERDQDQLSGLPRSGSADNILSSRILPVSMSLSAIDIPC